MAISNRSPDSLLTFIAYCWRRSSPTASLWPGRWCVNILGFIGGFSFSGGARGAKYNRLGLMNKTLAALIVGVMLAGAPARADILIGVAGPMTGSNAAFGEQFRRGAEKAVADLNAKGGVLGQRLRLVIGDDA